MDVTHIYESMLGERVDPYPGITNAFADGEKCARLYSEIYEAVQRISDRLGVEEDPDVEIILDNFWEIDRELCQRMYRYGQATSKT